MYDYIVKIEDTSELSNIQNFLETQKTNVSEYDEKYQEMLKTIF